MDKRPSINPLKTKRKLPYIKTQSYRVVNTFHLGYNNQPVYSVQVAHVAQVAVCSQINTKHINTVWTERTVVEC